MVMIMLCQVWSTATQYGVSSRQLLKWASTSSAPSGSSDRRAVCPGKTQATSTTRKNGGGETRDANQSSTQPTPKRKRPTEPKKHELLQAAKCCSAQPCPHFFTHLVRAPAVVSPDLGLAEARRGGRQAPPAPATSVAAAAAVVITAVLRRRGASSRPRPGARATIVAVDGTGTGTGAGAGAGAGGSGSGSGRRRSSHGRGSRGAWLPSCSRTSDTSSRCRQDKAEQEWRWGSGDGERWGEQWGYRARDERERG